MSDGAAVDVYCMAVQRQEPLKMMSPEVVLGMNLDPSAAVSWSVCRLKEYNSL